MEELCLADLTAQLKHQITSPENRGKATAQCTFSCWCTPQFSRRDARLNLCLEIESSNDTRVFNIDSCQVAPYHPHLLNGKVLLDINPRKVKNAKLFLKCENAAMQGNPADIVVRVDRIGQNGKGLAKAA